MFMKHPLACIDAVEAGVIRGGEAGIKKEGELFRVRDRTWIPCHEALPTLTRLRVTRCPIHLVQPPQACVQSETSKSLVHMFFATRSTATVPGYTDRGLKPRKIARVGVLGGGLMGAGIAAACLFNGLEVVLKEVNQQFLDAGLGRVKANIESMAKKKKLPADAVNAMLGRLRGTLDYGGFEALDMVIEAVLEDLKLKQQIFADLEKVCNPKCILSTNTSTIDITKVAAHVGCPDRVIGAHFFSPAHVMQLFEIVRTGSTSPQTVVDTLGFSKQIKKMPVVVGNCTGFAVNRVFFPYTMSACLAVDLGLDPYRIDAVISKRFGMPMVRTVPASRKPHVVLRVGAKLHSPLMSPPPPAGPLPLERPGGRRHRHARGRQHRGVVPRPRVPRHADPQPGAGQAPGREDRHRLLQVRRQAQGPARPGGAGPLPSGVARQEHGTRGSWAGRVVDACTPVKGLSRPADCH